MKIPQHVLATPSVPSPVWGTKSVIRLSRSTAPGSLAESSRSALPPVPCCGARFSSSHTCGSANVPAREAQSLTYVDNRAWVSQGPPLCRRVLSVMLLLLWAAMGVNLSWSKGKYGQHIDWIGTTITVRHTSVSVRCAWKSTSTKLQNS